MKMKNKEEYKVNNEDLFQLLMESTDEELRKRGLLIFQRPIHAWKNISARFGFGLNLTPKKKEPQEGSFLGDDLTIRIFLWYEKKFGERLKYDSNWKMPLIIRGDLFILKLPPINGKVEITCSPEEIPNGKDFANNIGIDKSPKINIFSLIEDITPTFFKSLHIGDFEHIMKQCQFGIQARIEIEQQSNHLLIKQAINDIFASVAHLITLPPNYGLSKWSSLQVAEKLFKSFIEFKGEKYEFIHNLKKLASKAETLGLNKIDDLLLKDIQCNAEIRYGDPPVNLFEAVQAYYSAVEISAAITNEMTELEK